jgi:hypothetical protein
LHGPRDGIVSVRWMSLKVVGCLCEGFLPTEFYSFFRQIDDELRVAGTSTFMICHYQENVTNGLLEHFPDAIPTAARLDTLHKLLVA